MKNITSFVIVLIAIIASSCEKYEPFSNETDDVLYLRNKEADMPVLIRGNTASKQFFVWLHGGPGTGSFPEKYSGNSVFDLLENDYANVFYDQRCAGNSTGKFDPENLNVDIMVEDLEKLIVLIKHRYGSDISIVLMGHSWGGTLGYSYLLKDENQLQVDGYVCVSGLHNTPLLMKQSKDETIALANRQIAFGNYPDDWQGIINDLNSYDETDTDNWLPMNRITHKTSSLMLQADSINDRDFDLYDVKTVFGTPAWQMFAVNKLITMNSPIVDEVENLKLTDQLSNISIPALLVSGKYDMVIPTSHVDVALEAIGSDEKEHVVFERSDHAPHFCEPEKFKNEIDFFIEKL